jgi:uncharacterized protein YxjI
MSTALTRYQTRYTAKKALFTFLGSAFRLYAPSGELAFFVKQKAFKLREQITVFADEAMSQPMLRIQARQRADFAATYDIEDAASGEVVGAMQRKGLKSILRDEWAILDVQGNEVGKVQEDSAALALLRRFIKLIPQTFHVTLADQQVGVIKQHFNPFVLGYDVNFDEAGDRLDRRMMVAMVVLLLAIEGRQQA